MTQGAYAWTGKGVMLRQVSKAYANMVKSFKAGRDVTHCTISLQMHSTFSPGSYLRTMRPMRTPALLKLPVLLSAQPPAANPF